jgi:hypothetical protein
VTKVVRERGLPVWQQRILEVWNLILARRVLIKGGTHSRELRPACQAVELLSSEMVL